VRVTVAELVELRDVRLGLVIRATPHADVAQPRLRSALPGEFPWVRALHQFAFSST